LFGVQRRWPDCDGVQVAVEGVDDHRIVRINFVKQEAIELLESASDRGSNASAMGFRLSLEISAGK
jgi:hypothetical protein